MNANRIKVPALEADIQFTYGMAAPRPHTPSTTSKKKNLKKRMFMKMAFLSQLPAYSLPRLQMRLTAISSKEGPSH